MRATMMTGRMTRKMRKIEEDNTEGDDQCDRDYGDEMGVLPTVCLGD
jgi:hypothetical protein